MLRQPGIYRARPSEWVVQEAKSSGNPMIVIKFDVLAMKQPNGDWATGHGNITGWFSLCKHNQLGGAHFEAMKNVFSWSGDSFAGLQATPLNETECQIVCENEDDEDGNPRVKVQWINSVNDEGGGFDMPEADDRKISKMDKDWSRDLRGESEETPTPVSQIDEGDIPF